MGNDNTYLDDKNTYLEDKNTYLDDDNDNNDEQMDISWIQNYEHEDEHYSKFYPENIKEIKINIMYVNKKRELEKINEKVIYLNTENKIKREQLVRIIKENERMDKIKYKLVSIVIYNIDLKHADLKNYMNGPNKYDFITSLRNIEDYELRPTINCFQEVNNIYIIFNEPSVEELKSALSSGNNDNKNSTTKRVRFCLADKKTRRRKGK
jgi:hypothetical protein